MRSGGGVVDAVGSGQQQRFFNGFMTAGSSEIGANKMPLNISKSTKLAMPTGGVYTASIRKPKNIPAKTVFSGVPGTAAD